ncbi:HalOD1 output domain-containing protein [Natronosalvus vescus]|uniref:HalOD1 output domain-containing protein n=1 Tax=Natronosalvus vescus TaxID=2953881 RepID=UPI002090D9DA|nr:HalOD1 output domain-containing protein [Natronosalvus vescus]
MESLEYQQDSKTYRAQYDQDTTTASMAVVATVTNALGVDPLELNPLHDIIDTDAVNELLRDRNLPNGFVHLSFRFAGCDISVSGDGVVTATPSELDGGANVDTGATHV